MAVPTPAMDSAQGDLRKHQEVMLPQGQTHAVPPQ